MTSVLLNVHAPDPQSLSILISTYCSTFLTPGPNGTVRRYRSLDVPIFETTDSVGRLYSTRLDRQERKSTKSERGREKADKKRLFNTEIS